MVGFRNWKKVRGRKCDFLNHVGKEPNTTHKKVGEAIYDLLNQKQHMPQVFDKQTA